MRTAALIIAAAAAFTLSACNRPAEDATETSTEAAEASGAAADTAAMSAEQSAAEAASAANAGGGGSGSAGGRSGSSGGQTMAPAPGSSVTDGAMAPTAQPPAGAGTTVTETERRLNPPQNSQPVQ